MKEETLAELFAEMMQKHFGARIVTVPSPTPEQQAEWRRIEGELAALSDDQLVALWDAADETYCCDDLYDEAQRRGIGDRVRV